MKQQQQQCDGREEEEEIVQSFYMMIHSINQMYRLKWNVFGSSFGKISSFC